MTPDVCRGDASLEPLSYISARLYQDILVNLGKLSYIDQVSREQYKHQHCWTYIDYFVHLLYCQIHYLWGPKIIQPTLVGSPEFKVHTQTLEQAYS